MKSLESKSHPNAKEERNHIEASYLCLALLVGTSFIVVGQIGARFQLSLDEAIYLIGAQKVIHGEAPYRIFFALTGPGNFWLFGILFRLCGSCLAVSRTVLSFELTLTSGIICWLVARFTCKVFAAAMAVLHFFMLLSSPCHLYINHRWDSNPLAVLAVASQWAGTERQERKYLLISGMLAGAAAWSTQTVAIVAVALLVWMLFQPTIRKQALLYSASVAVISAVALSVLLYQGALAPLVRHLLWSAGNYRSPNSVQYGYQPGDVTQLLAAGGTMIRAAEALVPALLPTLASVGWLLLLWRRKNEIAKVRTFASLLTVASAAMLIACDPRFGGHQLLFVTPLFWVLAAAALFLAIPAVWRTVSSIAVLIAAAALWIVAAPPPRPYRIQTQAGEVECSKKHYVLLSGLQRMIKPGDGLFVFPYLPMVYFATGGVTPPRYSFMHLSMMNANDEASVITDLRVHPPRWIIWHDFPERRLLQNLHKSDRPCPGCKTITPIRTAQL